MICLYCRLDTGNDEALCPNCGKKASIVFNQILDIIGLFEKGELSKDEVYLALDFISEKSKQILSSFKAETFEYDLFLGLFSDFKSPAQNELGERFKAIYDEILEILLEIKDELKTRDIVSPESKFNLKSAGSSLYELQKDILRESGDIEQGKGAILGEIEEHVLTLQKPAAVSFRDISSVFQDKE